MVGVQVSYNFCPAWLQDKHNSLLGFDYLLELLTKLRKTIYLPDYKDSKSGTARGKTRYGKGEQSFHFLPKL